MMISLIHTGNPGLTPWGLCVRRRVLCGAKRSKIGIVRSGKIIIETAYIIASKLKLLPEPLELLLRELGGGNGGGKGFWGGLGRGDSDGWKRGMRTKLGTIGLLIICTVLLVFVMKKELGLNVDDGLLGNFGFLLLGICLGSWSKGSMDWVLGFCCCAVLVSLILSKELIWGFEWTKKNGRRRKRAV